MSTAAIHQAVLRETKRFASEKTLRDHLDIGSGRGELIHLLHDKLGVASRACDYTTELMQIPNQPVDLVNLNHQPLPYPDQSFDLVTCSEVVEHLENYRFVIREIFRVLRPGGFAVLTTPNILNANSRLRFLGFGFYNLFGPLPVKNDKLYSTGGHITPIGWFHLAHALYDAGFQGVEPSIDKAQKSSSLKAAMLWPLIRLMGQSAMRKEEKKYRTLTEENRPLVSTINSWPLLTGRTLVVTAHKPV